MKKAISLILLLFILLPASIFCGEKSGSDWRHWLGNEYDGVSKETGLIDTLPATGPKILWRVPLKIGWSAPVIYDNLLFVTSMENRETEAVTCLDAFSGKIKWKHEYPTKYVKVAYYQGGPRAAAFVTDKYVYTIGTMGDLLCLDKFTGTVVWSKNLYKLYPPYTRGWKGYSISPVVEDGKVIVNLGPDAKKENEMCAAFDALTGKELWLYKRPVKIETTIQVSQTPQIMEVFGEKCVLYSPYARLSVLRLSDGKLLFDYTLPEGVNTISTPMLAGKTGILEQPFEKSLFMLEITGSKKNPEIKKVWSTKQLPSGHFSFVLNDGYYFGFASCFYLVALDAKTGALAWSKTDMKLDASLALADGKLYIRSGRDFIIAKAAGKKYEELARFTFNLPRGKEDYIAWVTPVIAHGKIYLRFSEELLCIEGKK